MTALCRCGSPAVVTNPDRCAPCRIADLKANPPVSAIRRAAGYPTSPRLAATTLRSDR